MKKRKILSLLFLIIILSCTKEETTSIILPFVIEFETTEDHNTGKVIYRSGASGSKVLGQFSCMAYDPWSAVSNGYIRFPDLHFPEGKNELIIELRYSKNSDPISWLYIKIDDIIIDSLLPANQFSWNSFRTDTMNIGMLSGIHTLEFFTPESQTYGTADLDKFTIKHK